MFKKIVYLSLFLGLLPSFAGAQFMSGGTFNAITTQILPVAGEFTGGAFSGSGAFIPVGANTSPSGGGIVALVGGPAVTGVVLSATTSTTTSSVGVLGGALPPIPAGSITATTPSPSPDQVYNVQIRFVSDREAIITYDTTVAARTSITYGNDRSVNVTGLSEAPAFTHSVRVKSLNPITKYNFAIYGEFVNGKNIIFSNKTYNFTTLKSATPELTEESIDEIRKPTGLIPAASAKNPENTKKDPSITPVIKDPAFVPAENTPVSPVYSTDCPSELTVGYNASGRLVLNWKNSKTDNFLKSRLLRSEDNFPTSLENGVLVYENDGEEFVDKDADVNVDHFYTLFGIDKTGKTCLGYPIKATAISATGGQMPTGDQIVCKVGNFRHTVMISTLIALWVCFRLFISRKIKKLLEFSQVVKNK